MWDAEEQFNTKVPGTDFAKLSGNRGGYTFFKHPYRSIEGILLDGGEEAADLINEWKRYEYFNKRAEEEYAIALRRANKSNETWDEIWKMEDQTSIGSTDSAA